MHPFSTEKNRSGYVRFVRPKQWLAIAWLGIAAPALLAFDVLPSRDSNPPHSPSGTGLGKLRLFATDPSRLEKAERVDDEKVEARVEVEPKSVSLAALRQMAPENDALKICLYVHNRDRKFYTLRFPTTQRLGVWIRDPSGQPVFVSPVDRDLPKEEGVTLLDPGDTLRYCFCLKQKDLANSLRVGVYAVETELVGYPKIRAKRTLSVTP